MGENVCTSMAKQAALTVSRRMLDLEGSSKVKINGSHEHVPLGLSAHCCEALREGTLRHPDSWSTGAAAKGPLITDTANLFAQAVNMSLKDSRPQALWVQAPFQPALLSAPTAVC